jgi:hypothetical protein
VLEPALSIECGAVDSLPPQAVVATPTPTAPAAKSAARERRLAIVRVGMLSTAMVAAQNGQIESPRSTWREHAGQGQSCTGAECAF